MSKLFSLICLIIIVIAEFTFVNSEVPATLPSERILNGEITQISKYPYIVSVRRRNCNDCAYEHYCGGTIFNEKIIITSATCVRYANVRDLLIVVGSSLRTGALQDGGMLYPVHETTLHEDETIDLALIHLQLELPINSNLVAVKAVQLATTMPKIGTLATIAGWGTFEKDTVYSEELREATVPILELEQCQSMDLTDNEICAGYLANNNEPCQGDAGGPLIVDNQMIGVTSWTVNCETGRPGVYTNIVKLSNWIVSHALGVRIAFL